LYVIWEKTDQIWAKIFCIPKNMRSRTPMSAGPEPDLDGGGLGPRRNGRPNRIFR